MLKLISRARRLAPACLLLAACPALAEPKAGKTVEEIVVTGAGAEARTAIDRRSYSLAKDLQATTGSLADALRSVPSVAVDAQGGLTLRGDANVTILVDGKPAGQFDGPGRGDALQQMSADQIERVEVITNPSAAMTPDGSGGVINLISKQATGRGLTRSVYGSYASAGAASKLGGSAGWNSGRLNVTATGAGQYWNMKGDVLRTRTGPVSTDVYEATSRGLNRNLNGRLAATWDADPKTRLSASAQTNQTVFRGHPQERFATLGSGARLDVGGLRRAYGDDLNLAAGVRRTLPGEGHELSLDLTRNRIASHARTEEFGVAAPPGPLRYTRIGYRSAQVQREAKLAYGRPLPGDAKLKAGLELRRDDQYFNNSADRGASAQTAVSDPNVTNRFVFAQEIRTAYATYERPVGDLTVLAGLRLEQVRIDLTQATTGQQDANDYSGAYPTLHLSYRLDDARTLTASYSQRIQRPPPSLMNPFRNYVSATDLGQGNPRLKPQRTQALEAAYQVRRDGRSLQATAYWRRNRGELTPLLRDLGGGIVLLTPENLGRSQRAGVELAANGRLTKTLTYNLSGDLYRAQVDPGLPGLGGRRTAYGIGGRGSLDWQAGAGDLAQLNVVLTGKRLLAQGYVYPAVIVNVGWRHRLSEKASVVASAQDVLGSHRFRQTLAAAAFTEQARYDPVSPTLVVRLDYRFGGGKPAKEPGFDFDAGSAAP